MRRFIFAENQKKWLGFDHRSGIMTLSIIHTKPDMDTTFKSRLTQFWHNTQDVLFPFLAEIEEPLTLKLKEVATNLEMLQIERFLPDYRGVGRPPKIESRWRDRLLPSRRSICPRQKR
jgi:hypothetical protein